MAKQKKEYKEEPTEETQVLSVQQPEVEEEDDDTDSEDIARPWDEVAARLSPQRPIAPVNQAVAKPIPQIKVTQDLGVVLLVKQGTLSADQIKEQSRGLRQYGPMVQVIIVDDFKQVSLKPFEG